MKLYYLLLFFGICSIPIYSQNLQNGLILSKDYKNAEQFFLIPNAGFNVYNENFQFIGKLEQNNRTLDQLPLVSIGGNKVELKFENFEQIGYEIYCLKYFIRKNGFVKIDSVRNYWLKESQIKERSYSITEWDRFFLDNSGEHLGLYPKDPGLNLRKSPSVTSDKLITLQGDNFEISLLGEKKGLWQKVEVKQTREHICNTNFSEEENFIKTWIGWVKLLDDSGLPNVYFYARGC